MSSSLGMGYLHLIVILLMALLSTHILILPSFWGTKRAGTTHGLKDSRIKPFSYNSSTCLWISIVSFGFILYASLFGRIKHGTRSVWCWISLLGGKPVGISSGNKWEKFSVSVLAMGWVGNELSGSSCMLSIHSLKALNSCWDAFRIGSVTNNKQSLCLVFFVTEFRGVWMGTKGIKWSSCHIWKMNKYWGSDYA